MTTATYSLQPSHVFYSKLGLNSPNDLLQLRRYFHTEKGSIIKNIQSHTAITANKIAHFFQTGVWINEQLIGQHLNEYRFYPTTTPGTIENIELIFNQNISADFTQKAYASASRDSFLTSLKNNLSFFFQFVKSPTTVGSLLPSSTKLAQEIIKEIPGKEIKGPSRRYLEVGPGLGTFTAELIKKLRNEDRLCLVEFDQKFVDILRKKFGHLKNVTIIPGDFTQFHSDIPYDHCISGLPLASFDQKTVEKIYRVFDNIIKKNGTIAYFEYLGIPQFKKWTSNKKFQAVLTLKEDYFKHHQGSSTNVWQNLTPARVCRLTV